MAKRSVRDMLKARAWKGQVSLADVDPGDRLGVKRKKIAAAREKYGPELLDLQERLFAEKKQAILKVQQLGTVFLAGGRYLPALESEVIAGVNVREAHLPVPGASLEHVPQGSLCH